MRRRLVLVSPFPLSRNSRHGGAKAVHGIVRALSERHDTVLLHLAGDAEVDGDLAARCIDVRGVEPPARAGWPRRLGDVASLARGRTLWSADAALPALQRRLRSISDSFRPEVVQVEHVVLGDVLSAVRRDALRLVTIHEPAAHLAESLSTRPAALRLFYAWDARTAIRQERRVLKLADAAVVFTERDRQVVARTAGADADIATIPLAVDVPPAALDPVGTAPPSLVFVGSYRHPPNVAAALHLARSIFPPLRSRHPDLSLVLVGELPPPELMALASERVCVTGAVPSVVPYLDRAAVVVVPLATGGGMRVKVLEALAAGKAVVTTTRGAEGVTAQPGQDLIVADRDDEFRAAVSALVNDAEARARLARCARAWAERELRWSVMADRYEQLYAQQHLPGASAVGPG